MGAHGGDDGLQFVAALAVHAHFVALNLRRHLEFAVADEAGDLLGDGASMPCLILMLWRAWPSGEIPGRIAPCFSC